MRVPLQIGLAVAIIAISSDARAQMRFQEMDRNADGVITRDEWRGNDRSFRNQDWNGDGVLSGDEVRAGARRQSNWGQDWNRDGRVDNFDTQIAQRYRGYDMNNDDRVGRNEWPGDPRLFSRLEARVFRPAMAVFTTNDAVLPFPLRQALDRVDDQLDQLIYEAFPKAS